MKKTTIMEAVDKGDKVILEAIERQKREKKVLMAKLRQQYRD